MTLNTLSVLDINMVYMSQPRVDRDAHKMVNCDIENILNTYQSFWLRIRSDKSDITQVN